MFLFSCSYFGMVIGESFPEVFPINGISGFQPGSFSLAAHEFKSSQCWSVPWHQVAASSFGDLWSMFIEEILESSII